MTLEEKLATTGNYNPVILTNEDVFELKALLRQVEENIREPVMTQNDREEQHLLDSLKRILKQVKE